MKLRIRSISSSNKETIITWTACFDGMTWLAMMMRLECGREEFAEIFGVLVLQEYEFVCLIARLMILS